jgi:hypothetical protein
MASQIKSSVHTPWTFRARQSGPCKSWIKTRNPNSSAYLRISTGHFDMQKPRTMPGLWFRYVQLTIRLLELSASCASQRLTLGTLAGLRRNAHCCCGALRSEAANLGGLCGFVRDAAGRKPQIRHYMISGFGSPVLQSPSVSGVHCEAPRHHSAEAFFVY